MSAPNILLAYLSPETVLPVTSIVAAIAGGSMFLTRRLIRLLVRCFRVHSGVRNGRPGRVSRTSKARTECSRRDDQQPG